MIFCESYNNVGGGQRILKKLKDIYTGKLNGNGAFFLTAPSEELYSFFGVKETFAVDYSRFNSFGNSKSKLFLFRSILLIPWFVIYTIRSVFMLRRIDGDLVVLDIRALLLMLPVKWICNKKMFFYAVGGSPMSTSLNLFLTRLTDKVFFISKELAIEFGNPEGQVVFNSIDTKKWISDMSNRAKDFVYVGSISQQKGLHSIVESFIRSDMSVTIDVYGEYPAGMEYYREYLEDLVENSAVELNFFGNVENMNELLREYKYFLFGSLRNSKIAHKGVDYYAASSEGSPTVIIEAILSGLYVFASDSTGVLHLKEFLGNVSIVDWEQFHFTNEALEVAQYKEVSKEKTSRFDYEKNYTTMLESMK